ncbi:serine/threonine-protein kinase PknL [Cutibacterium acnes JCM 18916]|nr:serine/threonine-protein kinase PknL [Cutibacterium acnes JCM 18916]
MVSHWYSGIATYTGLNSGFSTVSYRLPPGRIPTQPANHSQPRPRPIHRRATQPASRSRLAQDAVHRRRRGVIAAVFIVLVAVLCAYLVFHFTSSRYSASELHSTNSVARTCVHGESSCMHTVSQNI